MDKVKVCDLDFVYISFKEPNKEENWADLKNKVPWAKRKICQFVLLLRL